MDADHDAIWEIFHEVVEAGDTYPFDPQISREDGLAYWFQSSAHTYVAEQNDHVLGAYILRPNWSGPAGHVANAAFMVVQFNFVVSTNESAVRLLQRLGLEIVGTLPGAFRHPTKEYVDVYIMFRSLMDDRAAGASL